MNYSGVFAVRRPPAAAGAFGAAGVTWTSRTLAAQWGPRTYPTSVVDAVSGAIYVIGGAGAGYPQEAWASTDGGAHTDYVGGGYYGVLGDPIAR